MLYKKVPTDMKFVEREKEVEEFWKSHQIFEKSMKTPKTADGWLLKDEKTNRVQILKETDKGSGHHSDRRGCGERGVD